jgi:hypothetical protein
MLAIDNARRYDWPTWWIGILRAFISGGSSSMVAGLTSMGIAPGTFNLSGSLGNTLKLCGTMFLFQGGYRMFEFLQLHGAPDKLSQALGQAATATKEAGKAISEARDASPKTNNE